MMTERDSLAILLDYPKKHGLDFETHDSKKRFYMVPGDTFLNTKYVLFKKDGLMFYAFDTFAGRAYMRSTFTGIYAPMEEKEEMDLSVIKKDWTHRYLKAHLVKAGNEYVDQRVSITSRIKHSKEGLITKEAVDQLLIIQEENGPPEILIKSNYLSELSEFKNKTIVGLEVQRWVYQENEVDAFFNSASIIIESIRRALSNHH